MFFLQSAVTWAPVDIHSPSFSTWKSTTSYIVSIHRWLIKCVSLLISNKWFMFNGLFRHRETLITVIIIVFCILVGIIWNVRLMFITISVEFHVF